MQHMTQALLQNTIVQLHALSREVTENARGSVLISRHVASCADVPLQLHLFSSVAVFWNPTAVTQIGSYYVTQCAKVPMLTKPLVMSVSYCN